MVALVRNVKVEGLKELEKALAELPRATARNTLKRVLMKAGEPIADAARINAPRQSGELADSIQISAKVKNKTGNAEYAAAMRAGLGAEVAVAAMRGARRASRGQGSFAEVHVGPAQAKSKHAAIKRIVQEFGSVNYPGKPYMRPAWDAEQDTALDIIKRDLGDEIMKSAKRIAQREARRAAKIKAGG